MVGPGAAMGSLRSPPSRSAMSRDGPGAAPSSRAVSARTRTAAACAGRFAARAVGLW